jgi:aminocarboxymuconate-semialdehyde decarboxylase
VIVDVHAHAIVPEITRERGDDPWRPVVRWEDGAQVVELGGLAIRSAVREFVRVERMLEEAAGEGIDRLLLSPWVNLLGHDLEPREAAACCAIQNDALAEACRSDRIDALGTVPLQDPPKAAASLERLMAEGALAGVEVGASVRGTWLGDDRFAPFWEVAEATAALVLVHPTTRGFPIQALQEHYLWNTVGNPLETAASVAHLVMAGVLERHPGLRIVVAHGGGALMAVRGRLRHAHGFQPQARSRLSEAPDVSLRRLYYDSITHDPALLADLVAFAGPERVLLGTDRPFDMGTTGAVEEISSLGLDEADTRAILGVTAATLLGVKR